VVIESTSHAFYLHDLLEIRYSGWPGWLHQVVRPLQSQRLDTRPRMIVEEAVGRPGHGKP
jgi:hypothetical protein